MSNISHSFTEQLELIIHKDWVTAGIDEDNRDIACIVCLLAIGIDTQVEDDSIIGESLGVDVLSNRPGLHLPLEVFDFDGVAGNPILIIDQHNLSNITHSFID